jgi:phosphoserine aminotransferase
MSTQSKDRVFNFSSGPAALPLAVLERAREELLSFRGSGMSIMEMSHRSDLFDQVLTEAETGIRELLEVPSNYRVLFLQGGAAFQFSMIPMNFLSASETADYVLTGYWGEKAVKEARRCGVVNIVFDGKANGFRGVPRQGELDLTMNASYVHYTSNETIGGVEFHFVPNVGDVPLVVDMSSNILSRPIDVSKFGLIYAGAQKNIGPAGLTLVIVREDLLGKARKGTPAFMDFAAMAKDGSMLNTPPTLRWPRRPLNPFCSAPSQNFSSRSNDGRLNVTFILERESNSARPE